MLATGGVPLPPSAPSSASKGGRGAPRKLNPNSASTTRSYLVASRGRRIRSKAQRRSTLRPRTDPPSAWPPPPPRTQMERPGCAQRRRVSSRTATASMRQLSAPLQLRHQSAVDWPARMASDAGVTSKQRREDRTQSGIGSARKHAQQHALVRALRVADRRRVAKVMQVPRRHQPVAAVVARACAWREQGGADATNVQGRLAAPASTSTRAKLGGAYTSAMAHAQDRPASSISWSRLKPSGPISSSSIAVACACATRSSASCSETLPSHANTVRR